MRYRPTSTHVIIAALTAAISVALVTTFYVVVEHHLPPLWVVAVWLVAPFAGSMGGHWRTWRREQREREAAYILARQDRYSWDSVLWAKRNAAKD